MPVKPTYSFPISAALRQTVARAIRENKISAEEVEKLDHLRGLIVMAMPTVTKSDNRLRA